MANNQFFNPGRTQPFLVTFFMAVLAFRRLWKRMKQAKEFKNRQMFPSHSQTKFQAVLKRSQRNILLATKGRTIMGQTLPASASHELIRVEEASKTHESIPTLTRSQSTRSPTRSKKILKKDDLVRQVARQVAQFHRKLHVDRASELKGRLEILSRERDERAETPSPSAKRPHSSMNRHKSTRGLLKNTYFQQFALPGANEFNDSGGPQLEVGEYLESTSIYFGATIALQARHGGFLSYASQEIKASAHKIMNQCRFVVKKSDDLTDIGAVCYGDALWLQASTTTVLGARYGSLVDQKRAIQPSLISCKRQNMFKANQYGRWIILNRDDPMGTLGKNVGHFDRVILEQEWYFLASASPYESSMYKSINNSDEAMTTKIDLFRPTDECVWKVHLVDLPLDDKENERQRQQLLQDAKDQIDRSERTRYTKGPLLLNSLSNSLPVRLRDDMVVSRQLHHKTNLKSEQEYYMKMFQKISEKDFGSEISSAAFLGKIYGRDSPIAHMARSRSRSPRRAPGKSESPSRITHGHTFLTASSEVDGNLSASESNAAHATNGGPSTAEVLQSLENDYWDQAQRVLVPTKCWAELPAVMEEFEEKDAEKKLQAALVLQRWLKKLIEQRFNYSRAMKKVDGKARARLEEKSMQRRQLLLEHSAAIELTKKEIAKQSALEIPVSRGLFRSTTRSRFSHEAGNIRRSLSRSVASIPRSNSLDTEAVIAVANEIIHSSTNPFQILDPGLNKSRSMSVIRLVSHDSADNNKRTSVIGLAHLNKAYSSSFVGLGNPSEILPRPASASALPNARASSPPRRPASAIGSTSAGNMGKKALEKQRDALIRTPSRDYGLPADVFEDMKDRTNVAVGLKFLRAMSAQPDIYQDLSLVRKRKKQKEKDTKKYVGFHH